MAFKELDIDTPLGSDKGNRSGAIFSIFFGDHDRLPDLWHPHKHMFDFFRRTRSKDDAVSLEALSITTPEFTLGVSTLIDQEPSQAKPSRTTLAAARHPASLFPQSGQPSRCSRTAAWPAAESVPAAYSASRSSGMRVTSCAMHSVYHIASHRNLAGWAVLVGHHLPVFCE